MEYKFNLENIFKFIFDEETNASTSTEITESYVQDDENNELVLSNKILREVKGDSESSSSAIKYDLIKLFISALVNTDANEISVGSAIITNTMAEYGMITQIKNTEE